VLAVAWFIGSDEHFALLAVAALLELTILLRRSLHRHHRVSHRKLRALAARRVPATNSTASRNAPVAGTHELRAVSPSGGSKTARKGGSSAVRASSASSTPAHACPPRAGVGPQLQATAPAWTRGSATTAPSAEPHPTSGDLPNPLTGRGPQLRTATTDRCPRLRSAASGGPGQQPVDVAMPPDATSTGPQRRTP
jgi:hypothetical protein